MKDVGRIRHPGQDQQETKADYPDEISGETCPFMMPFRNGENTGPVKDMSKFYPTGNPGRGTYVQNPEKSIQFNPTTIPIINTIPKQSY
jgi:hypothetical protein